MKNCLRTKGKFQSAVGLLPWVQEVCLFNLLGFCPFNCGALPLSLLGFVSLADRLCYFITWPCSWHKALSPLFHWVLPRCTNLTLTIVLCPLTRLESCFWCRHLSPWLLVSCDIPRFCIKAESQAFGCWTPGNSKVNICILARYTQLYPWIGVDEVNTLEVFCGGRDWLCDCHKGSQSKLCRVLWKGGMGGHLLH